MVSGDRGRRRRKEEEGRGRRRRRKEEEGEGGRRKEEEEEEEEEKREEEGEGGRRKEEEEEEVSRLAFFALNTECILLKKHQAWIPTAAPSAPAPSRSRSTTGVDQQQFPTTGNLQYPRAVK